MPITTRKPAPAGVLQRFRGLTEGYLLREAQRAMLAEHPGTGSPPAAQRGLVYRLLPWLFLPGFRLTPWAIKRRLLPAFFLHREQRWPERPWERS